MPIIPIIIPQKESYNEQKPYINLFYKGINDAKYGRKPKYVNSPEYMKGYRIGKIKYSKMR